MMPEHAVLAYTELNGTMFHGRMFHILPGKSNERKEEDDDDTNQNFKYKKQQELKRPLDLLIIGTLFSWAQML